MSSSVKNRYQAWTVFLVVAACNVAFVLLGILVMFMSNMKELQTAIGEMLTWTYFGKNLVGMLFQATFFYFSLNHFNRLMVEKAPAAKYILCILVMVVVTFSYYVLMYKVFPPKSSMERATNRMLILFSFTFTTLFLTSVSLLIAYLNNLRDEKKHRKVLEAQKMQLEVDKSHANFKFLKSQINPHFLHNTLNFLYAKSLPYSAELSEGILTLSEIMRYALNEAKGADDKAPLKDEIEHVRNVIKINQLRFSNNLYVNFEVEGVVNGAEIIPFALITIVENAFKHGDLQKREHPIDIRLVIDRRRLVFRCHNKKKSGPKEISTGLGLDNIRNRLDFAYGTGYQLSIREDAMFYTTELTIENL